jgi:hypothetical protein
VKAVIPTAILSSSVTKWQISLCLLLPLLGEFSVTVDFAFVRNFSCYPYGQIQKYKHKNNSDALMSLSVMHSVEVGVVHSWLDEQLTAQRLTSCLWEEDYSWSKLC